MSSRTSIDPNLDRREAALRFLFGRIDYERALNVPYRRQEFKLGRMRELLNRLGNPQDGMPIVHVAGTKGKGSTAAMIGSVLGAAGYRAGVFNSPHLDQIEERMLVGGQPCSGEELVEMVDRLRPVVEAMDQEAGDTNHDTDSCLLSPDSSFQGPTYFEITTAMALLHFARRRVDLAVLEVGLGGRLDSTNVCTPLVSVITSISFDHVKQLGNRLDSIAREKAGIVKPGVPVVSGVIEPEPREAIREVCRRHGCRLIERGVDFDFDYRPPEHLERAPAAGRLDFRFRTEGRQHAYADLGLGLAGRHQAANAAVALATLAELRGTGWDVPEAAVRAGLADVSWPARVEVVARRPAIVIDTAHNLASIEVLVQTLAESFSAGRRLLIFAGTQEKDLRGMLRCVLRSFDRVILTRYLTNPRAVPPEELAALAVELTGRQHTVCSEPAQALRTAVEAAGPEDLICVAGSFFIAAEIRRQLTTCPPPVTEAETG